MPRIWPKTNQFEIERLQLIVDLLVEILQQSNWQIQILIIKSTNEIIQRNSNILLLNFLPLIQPIINLGPRSKTANLKREILLFLKNFLSYQHYEKYFHENQDLKTLLQFNVEEMIHDTRSNEISEQAKQLKKEHENLFEKTQQIEQIVSNETNLF